MQVKRKYFVLSGGQYFEVYPRNTDKLKFVTTQERDQIFYRKKLSGKLTFVNNAENSISDYTFFRNIEFSSSSCDEIKFEIRRFCNGSYYTEWRGYFTTTKGSFDLDKCTFTVEPVVDDEYRCILDNWDREFNILEVSTKISTDVFINNENFEYKYCRSNSSDCAACLASLPAPTASWRLLHNVKDNDINGDWICIYFREKVVSTCIAGQPTPPTGSGWLLLSDDCSINNTATYVRLPSPVTNNPNPNVVAGLCNSGIAELPPPPVSRDIALGNQGNIDVWDIQGVFAIGYTKTNKYVIDVDPSSALTWHVSDPLGCLASYSSSSNVLTLTTNTGVDGTVLISCTEINSCGDTIEHKLTNPNYPTSVVEVNFFSPGNITTVVVGSKELCTNQVVTYEIPEQYRIFGTVYTWSYDATLFEMLSNTNYQIVLRCRGVIGSSTISIFGFDYGNQMATGSLSGTVNVRNAPRTGNIEGLENICLGATGIKYFVWNRIGSTYNWTIIGGTIVSGNGSNEIYVDWDNIAGDHKLTVKETAICGCNYTLIVDCETGNDTPYFICPENQGTTITVDDNRDLFEVINFLIAKLPCDLYDGEMISDFFEVNPSGDTIGYVPTLNYVTGLGNKVNHLTIAQKSDVILYAASNPATIGKTTLKKISDIFREMFCVYWFLDLLPSGLYGIRFEHFKHFNLKKVTGLNLGIDPYLTQVKSMNKYDHLNESLPKFERFKFMEAINQDFIGSEIWYDSLCVNQDPDNNVQDHNVSEVTTDVQAILTSPNDISPNGFVILANQVDGLGNYSVISEIGLLSGSIYPNNHLSWANLHYNYLRWDRILKEGYMNNVLTSFYSFKKNIKQSTLSIGYCCDVTLDPNDLVITQLGNRYFGGIYSSVESLELQFDNDILKLNLLYSYQP